MKTISGVVTLELTYKIVEPVEIEIEVDDDVPEEEFEELLEQSAREQASEMMMSNENGAYPPISVDALDIEVEEV